MQTGAGLICELTKQKLYTLLARLHAIHAG